MVQVSRCIKNSYECHVHASSTPLSLCLDGGKCNLIGNQCPVRVNWLVDYFWVGPRCGFPRNGMYEDPVVALIAKDARLAKSPAQIIAEAHGGGAAGPETVQGGGIALPTKECQHPAVSAAHDLICLTKNYCT
mmetsp:Transcript_25418/g.53584  ORF Transcript_25418/g.53584 Transcript_25418/m.53584 type:complete len:133 (-) Transcript_25418:431-829(-)